MGQNFTSGSSVDQKISYTAAALAAAAIYEVFPGSELLDGGVTSTGFFYQFSFSKPLPPEAIQLIEERMRMIIRERRPLMAADMVALSAKGLFLRLGHTTAIRALDQCGPKAMVAVVGVGEFFDLMEGEFCSSLQEVGAFQIVSLEDLGEKEYRIDGCAFGSKDELKSFLRQLKKYEDENHLELGQKGRLWQWRDGRLLWREKGLEAKRRLVARFKIGEELGFESQDVMDQFGRDKTPVFTWTFSEKRVDPEGDEGLFESCCQSLLQQNIYCSQGELNELLISHLQTIDKSLIILGFRATHRLTGRKGDAVKQLKACFPQLVSTEEGDAGVEWILLDGLGRERVAVELKLTLKENRAVVRVSVGIEKILALLIEKTLGNLACLYEDT